jgi:hypothetical protein
MAAEQLAGEVAKYCRELESYLCQKNEGHLIRIVGPAFEQVCSWAERGVPLKIAFRGIDRYCERYYAKPGRRRPVRIEFCEADILDAFDEWRRALGVSIGSDPAGESGSTGRRPSLSSHIERILARLRTLATTRDGSAEFLSLIDRAICELESVSPEARAARGEARTRIIERLTTLDRELTAAAVRQLDSARAAELAREAEAELAQFGTRLTSEARERAAAAAYERLVRETLGLPTMTYD